MKVNNFDCNGKPIEDISKVVLPDELSSFVYQIFLNHAIEKKKKQRVKN